MIRHIRGTVADVALGYVVIDVAGVGYVVYTNASHTHLLGSTTTLFTHLAVRETALDLYGFATRDELELFLLLLTIPKIGPKSALEILTKADLLTIKNAVLSNDADYLTKVSGIGKKTAEKIVLGLKDSFEHLASTYQQRDSNDALPPYTVDAIDALVALGYPSLDARRVILALPSSIASTNEAVREALKQLGQA